MYSSIVDRNQKQGRKATYTLRFYVVIQGKKKTANFKLTGKQDSLAKDHQHLTNLFWDIEDRQKDGGVLSQESRETIRTLKATNPSLVDRWIEDGWFRNSDVSVLTLEQAFQERIKQMRLDGNDERTCTNWMNTAKRIYRVIEPTTLVTAVDLKMVKVAFGNLRTLKKSNGEPYSTDTLKKDASNLRVLFSDLEELGDIAKSPIRKYKFSVPKHQRPEPKPDVSQEDFLKVLAQFVLPDELEQYTLLCYYRLMSARQNDPKFEPERGNEGDHWDHVDFDRKCVNRWNIKTRSRQGWFPCNDFMWKVLMRWHDHVVAVNGKAEGPIFPWLNKSKAAAQRKWYRLRIERALGPYADWRGVSQTLRCNRSRDLRGKQNGRYLESQLVGHSEEVADKHYDLVQADRDFPQIWDEPEWKFPDEENAA